MAAEGADTKLLLHCNGADESTDFPDSSLSDHTVTANATATIRYNHELGAQIALDPHPRAVL